MVGAISKMSSNISKYLHIAFPYLNKDLFILLINVNYTGNNLLRRMFIPSSLVMIFLFNVRLNDFEIQKKKKTVLKVFPSYVL